MMSIQTHRNISAALWFIAFAATVMTATATTPAEYLPSVDQMRVFADFRDPTLTAFIAIVAILGNFANSLLRERSTVKASEAEVEKARIHAEALSGIGARVDHLRDSVHNKLAEMHDDIKT